MPAPGGVELPPRQAVGVHGPRAAAGAAQGLGGGGLPQAHPAQVRLRTPSTAMSHGADS